MRAPLRPPVGARRPGHDVAVLHRDLRAHRLQALDVLIDRPRADRAAARQRHRRLAEAGQQRAEDENRGAHRLDELVGRLARGHLGGAQRHPIGAAGAALGRHAHVAQQLEGGLDVMQRRHVDRVTGSAVSSAAQSSGSAAFLAPGDGDFARQTATAADDELVHAGPPIRPRTSATTRRGSASSSTGHGSPRASGRRGRGRRADAGRRGSCPRTRSRRWSRRSGARRPRPRECSQASPAAMNRSMSAGVGSAIPECYRVGPLRTAARAIGRDSASPGARASTPDACLA